MTEPNLDGILIDLAVANIDGSYGYDEEAHDKATKAIKALIANQVREARIKELKLWQSYWKNGKDTRNTDSYVSDRIKELGE